MKVSDSTAAKWHIAKRRSFRWMGWRGMKSKTAEGVYGLFYRKGMPTHEHYKVTLLLAVYEPRTAMWYTSETWASILRVNRLDFPDPASNIRWVNAAWLLQDVYKRGYPALAEARIMGHL